jgi:hypothetical protein
MEIHETAGHERVWLNWTLHEFGSKTVAEA